MITNNITFGQIDNAFVNHAVQIIEDEFNTEYKVYHKNVVILVDSMHSIEVENLNSYSRINHFQVLISKELAISKNRLLCNSDSTLLIHFQNGRYINLPTIKYLSDVVSFSSNVSKTQSLSGKLFPNYDIINGNKIHKEPRSFFICSFDIE